MRLRRGALALAALLALVAQSASADLSWYSDRASWTAAAGGSDFYEGFSAFTADTSFRSAPLALAGASIAQVGSGRFRNEVEVGPYDFAAHPGNPHASLFSNADGGPTPAVDVELVFDAPNASFGFEHWAAADGEGLRLEVYDGVTRVGSHALPNAFGGFLGYVLGPGSRATSVRFVSAAPLVGPGDPGEGFAIDELEGRTLPEPSGLAALLAGALALVGLCGRRAQRSPRALSQA